MTTKTQHRRLRTGKTLWEAITPAILVAAKNPARSFYDVVIIGAGISGALVADALPDMRLHVLMIDRRLPASGSTSASTALIQWEIDEPLGALVKTIGRTRAIKCYQASRSAVRKLARNINANGLSCDFSKRGTLLIAGDRMNGKALATETKLRRSVGLPSRFLNREQVRAQYGFDREGAILSTGSCEVDPRKLTRQLLLRAQRNGVEIVARAEAAEIDATRNGVFIRLENGVVIAARKVIAATGYEVLPQVPGDGYRLNSTWALATVPVRKDELWRDSVLVWEASDPYLYFRTTADDRIVVGGEDEEFVDPARRDALIEKKSAKILAKLKKLLPQTPLKIAYQWAGTFASSPNGLPVIGELETLPNVFVILASGGNGITFSTIAAEMAAAWVRGKSHPHDRLFGPNVLRH